MSASGRELLGGWQGQGPVRASLTVPSAHGHLAEAAYADVLGREDLALGLAEQGRAAAVACARADWVACL